jgi:hypothetical protein
MNALTNFDHGTGEMVQVVETATAAAAAQAKALVEARFIVALRRPRDFDVARERLLKDCRRPSFAAGARYVKPIGKDKNKWPTGPSIRFAEAAIRAMTNIAVDTMSVYDDREKRIVRVTVTDLEANATYSLDVTVTKAVERKFIKDGDVVLRSRKNSYGDDVHLIEATDDDILNKQAALISKAIRTLGLRLIPGDLIDECMDIVVQTQRNEDARDPDAARRSLFDGFADLGVGAESLKALLGHNGETLTPAERDTLKGIYRAVRDGETTWREVMEAQGGDDRKPGTITMPQPKPKATQPDSAGPAHQQPVGDDAGNHADEAPRLALDGRDQPPVTPAAQRRVALSPQQVKVLTTKAKAVGLDLNAIGEQVGGLYVENVTAIHKAIDDAAAGHQS